MANYVLLERIELNASAASVTFSNIPQTGYTDLKVVMSARSTGTGDLTTYVGMVINNDTGAYYDQRNLSANLNGTTSNQTWTNQNEFYVYQINTDSSTTSTYSNVEIYLPNYTSTVSKYINNDGAAESNTSSSGNRGLALVAGLYHPATNTAINSLKFTPSGGSFAQYSTFSLYGLAAVGSTPAIAPKASGGNRIDYDGTYWYHTFLASGTFVPQVGISADVLVVAGGGSGTVGRSGTYYGAGAGAGKVAVSTSQVFTNGVNYSITIGGGGAGLGNTVLDVNGNNGTASSVSGGAISITSTAGSGPVNSTGVGGTSGNGFTGGGAVGTAPGGGAGAGGNGGGGGGAGGYGGPGLNTWSSWASATSTGDSGYYGGGGAATGGPYSIGVGGLGGGGGGSTGSFTYKNGFTNTGGGGGGGAYQQQDSGNGGSGIVIVRYAI